MKANNKTLEPLPILEKTRNIILDIGREKRNVRSYKIADKFYFDAQKRAAKEKTTVGNIIEGFLITYSKVKK